MPTLLYYIILYYNYQDRVEVGVSRQGYGWCDTEGNHRRRAEPLIGLWRVGH